MVWASHEKIYMLLLKEYSVSAEMAFKTQRHLLPHLNSGAGTDEL